MTGSARAGGAEPLIPKSEFVGLDGVAHLCTGGEAPWLHSHQRALERFGRHKSGGMGGRDELFAVYASAKTRVARLLGIEPARVAFLAHASEGLNLAVHAVDWRPGDNAVVADVEYPSLVYPIAALRERGVEARVVRTERGYLSMDALAGAASPGSASTWPAAPSWRARAAPSWLSTRRTPSAWPRWTASSATSSCPPATSGCSPPTAWGSSRGTPSAWATRRPRRSAGTA
jgi:hypothetical protein